MTVVTKTPARIPAITADIFGDTLTLNFPLTKGNPELQIDITKLSPEIVKQATLHGLKQKLSDAAAIARNTATGASATPEDKYAAVKSVFDRLTGDNATWNAVREGVERGPSNIFVRAIAEATGKDYEATAAQVKAMTKEQQSALKKNPRIVDIIHRMEREEAAKSGNTGDDLLALLAGDGIPTDGNTSQEGGGNDGSTVSTASADVGDGMVVIPDRRTKAQKAADAKRREGN